MPYVGYNLNAGYDGDNLITDDTEAETLDTQGGFIVGVGAEFALTPGILPVALKVRPSVETVFVPSAEGTFSDFEGAFTVEATQTFFQASADLIAELSPPLSPVIPYVGLGLTYVTYELELSASDLGSSSSETTDGSSLGANVLGGVRFGGGFVAPFVQARYSLADPSPDEFEDADIEIGNGFSILAGVSIGL